MFKKISLQSTCQIKIYIKFIIILLIALTSCNKTQNETNKTQNEFQGDDIFTNLDVYYRTIESFDTTLKRNEFINSLIGKQVAWRLYVSDVKKGLWGNYEIHLSRKPDSYELILLYYETSDKEDKEYALSFSKNDKVTLKGKFTLKGLIGAPFAEDAELVRGWE